MENLTFNSIIGGSLQLISLNGLDNRNNDEKELSKKLNSGEWILVTTFDKKIDTLLINQFCIMLSNIIKPEKILLHENTNTISIIINEKISRQIRRQIKRLFSNA